jgi:hypothetical protein
VGGGGGCPQPGHPVSQRDARDAVPQATAHAPLPGPSARSDPARPDKVNRGTTRVQGACPRPGSGRRCAPLSPGRKGGGREHFLLCSCSRRRRHCIHTPSGVSGPGPKFSHGQPAGPGRAGQGKAGQAGRTGGTLARGARPPEARTVRGVELRSAPEQPAGGDPAAECGPTSTNRASPGEEKACVSWGGEEALSLRKFLSFILNAVSLRMTLFPSGLL